MKRHVALVGFNPRTIYLAKDIPADVEVWSLNWAWMYKKRVPRIDRLFEIHPSQYLKSKDDASKKHFDWLLNRKHAFPVYLIEKDERIDNSVVYPFEEICAELAGNITRGDKPVKVFTSTFDYMMALAIFEGVEEITLIGCEMDTQTEYGYQQPGFAYWLGQADARGIKVHQPAETVLLRAKVYHEGGQMIGRNLVESILETYEITRDQFVGEYNALLGQFQLVRRQLDEGIVGEDIVNDLRGKVLQAKEHLNLAEGAVQATNLILKQFDVDDPDRGLKLGSVLHVGKNAKKTEAELNTESEVKAAGKQLVGA